ncbi:MAG: zinc ribbon domain-containing protein [Desulfobacteraceae bacterium]|nr:MAG: zinc ribbon domain-containing protein [Desulfobacteraceae bacterium]
MPIYEFRCNKCGMEFEQIVFSSNEEVPCPGCGKDDTCRLMSSFSCSSPGSAGNSSGSSCSGHSHKGFS